MATTNEATASSTENTGSSSRRTVGGGLLAMLPGRRSVETPEQQRTRQAFSAARMGNASVLQALLAEHPDLLLQTDQDGNNLLNTAVLAGKKASLLSVIHIAWQPDNRSTWRAVLNHTNNNGETALWQAVNGRHKDMVSILATHNETDLNLANRQSRTPLYQAAYQGYSDIVAELLRRPRVNPNLPDNEGNTPLIMATRYNYADIVSALAKRPDTLTDLANLRGQTPLSMAVDKHLHAVLKGLLKNPNISLNRPDEHGNTPVWRLTNQLVEHMAVEGWREDYHAELVTLGMLLRSGKADFNYINNTGETPLTYLCRQEPRFEGETYQERFHEARLSLMKTILADSASLPNPNMVNPSAKNIDGESPLRIAFNQGNNALAAALFLDKRTDRNTMAGTLVNQPELIHKMMFPDGPRLNVANISLKNAFIIESLQAWVLFRQPDGKSSVDAARSHFELSKLKYPALIKMIKGRTDEVDCRPNTAMKHAQLALELLMVGGNLSSLPVYAKQALVCSPSHSLFNIAGVNIPRGEVENWANGQIPERMIMAQMEQNLRQFRGVANVHQHGFTARGRVILTTIQECLKSAPSSLLSFDHAKEAILSLAAQRLEQAKAMPDTDPVRKKKSVDRASLVTEGVEHAETQNQPVREGLDTNTHDTLRTMWSYIQMQQGEDKEHLIDSLFTRLADIGAEQVCNTGCVQRILYCVEGVDAAFLSQAPTADMIRDEIRSILGQVNNYFEETYQYAPIESDKTASSSAGPGMLTDAQHIVEKYHEGGINEELVLEVKQDIARASVVSDLVVRRGWDRATVEALLQPELESMKYV